GDRPARRGPGTGVERPGTANRGGEQVADVLAAARHDGGALQHRVAAAARGAVAVQRDGEGVPGGDGAAAHREPADPLAHRARQVDRVIRTAHHVEVVAGDAVVEEGRAGRVAAVIPGRRFQVVLELL